MAKKKIEITEGSGAGSYIEVDIIEPKTISPVTAEFNREDLNELRDRLNEVIETVNSTLA